MTEDTSTPPTTVPAWLQRRMLRNLRSAARNRIFPGRAAKAREILAAIERDGEPQSAKPTEGTSLGVGTTIARASRQFAANKPTGGRPHSLMRGTWAARLGDAAKALANRVSRWRPARRAMAGS